MNPEDTQQVSMPSEPQQAQVPVQPQQVPQEFKPPEKGKGDAKPVKKKKKPLLFILILTFLVFLLGGGYYIYSTYGGFSIQPPVVEPEPEPEPEPTPQPQPEPEPEPETQVYTNTEFEFRFEYPLNASYGEQNPFSNDPSYFFVAHAGERQESEILSEKDIVDGYMFKIVVHKDVLNTDLNKFISDKRKLFAVNCYTYTEISDVFDATLSTAFGKTFNVINCDQDYIETIVLRDDFIFEIVQVYRGDLGFKQKYKSITDEIYSSFVFTNTLKPTPVDSWSTYQASDARLTFKYPQLLSQTCCTVSGPVLGKSSKLVVFGDAEGKSQSVETSFNGFGVYNVMNENRIPFEDYVEEQKQALIENYRVVIGRNPTTTEEMITIDGQEAYLLKGYAWWGDVFFVQVPESNRIAVFSMTEVSPGEFESVFREILSTVEFIRLP